MASSIVPWTNRKKRISIAKDDPSSGALQRNLGRLFNEFLASSLVPEVLSEPLSQFGDRLSGFNPAVNVLKSHSQIVITIEVPGMDERDIEISLTKDGLTIRGERRAQLPAASAEGESYEESLYGAFERIVPLAGLLVNEDEVEATASKGMVTITLPLAPQASGSVRRVSIRPE